MTRVVSEPARHVRGAAPREVTLTVGWGAMSGIDLEPAGCSDPNCDADHGYVGSVTAEDLTLRVSENAEGPEIVSRTLRLPPSCPRPRRGRAERSLRWLVIAQVTGHWPPCCPLAAGLGVRGFEDELDVHVDARRVCVLLVDELGLLQLRARSDAAPFLASLVNAAGSSYLRAGFPSTTAACLTSLGTGLSVGRHGVVGYSAAVPGENRIVNLLRWEGVDPLAWQPHPTVSERVALAGVPVTVVSSAAWERSGLTLASLRGTTWASAESIGDRVATAAAALRHDTQALVYVYYSDLDSTGHRVAGCPTHGPTSWRMWIVLSTNWRPRCRPMVLSS